MIVIVRYYLESVMINVGILEEDLPAVPKMEVVSNKQ